MNPYKIEKGFADEKDMEKISRYARRELTADELYIFNVTLCSNEVDRDFEKFSVEALHELAELFIGKTGIFDHSMKSSDQKARIFDTCVEQQKGEKTADGEDLYCLRARAYMLKNDENRLLIDEIDAGIKKEVSVSCRMGKSVCSVCGKDVHSSECAHIRGREYAGKPCFHILSDAKDAYEFSFVAVPAQREAGITKAFALKSKNGDEIVKTITACDTDVTLTKAQVSKLGTYIDELKAEASLGTVYKQELAKEVTKLFAAAFPDMDRKLFTSVVSVMTAKELLGFKQGMAKKSVPAPQPQLLAANKTKHKENYSQFKI